MSGLYVHIPFCKSRCIYCGFYSTTHEELRSRYVDSLCEELRLRRDYLDDRISTIYLGGGTPSQLCQTDIDRIFDAIYKYNKVEDSIEATFECNPDDITESLADYIKSSPINRVSMGAQSFSDDILSFIRRRHNASQIISAVERLRKADVSNISIDLMFGFPQESIQTWRTDIESALNLEIEHISAYSLMYEEGTAMTKLLLENRIKECDEETYLAMYNILIDKLVAAGYEHYEISNFAKSGYRSIHNSNYWNDIPYLGIGASAHSFNRMARQWNIDDISSYMESISKKTIPAETEFLTKDSRFDDVVMTRLRTCEGIDMIGIKKNFGEDYLAFLYKEAAPHIENGLMTLEGSHLHLTRKGLFVSDSIISDLMHV